MKKNLRFARPLRTPAGVGAGRGPGGPPHKLAALLSTWFGCGYSPLAPGTAGSLAALLILIAIAFEVYADFAWWHFLLPAAILLGKSDGTGDYLILHVGQATGRRAMLL